MKISIIITTLNNHRFIQQRLFEIYKFIPEEFIEEIIISNDDRPSKEMIKVIDNSIMDGYNIFLVDNYKPSSFSANVNRGVNYSCGEYVLVTQDDVMISGNFMSSLIQCLLEQFGSVFGKVLSFDTGWNNLHGYIIPYIEGWFIACSRDVWDTVGGMDEEIAPYDAEDIDWSIRAKEAGYNLVGYESMYLQHIGGQTISMDENRRRITEKNIEYLKNKWTREKLGEIYE